MGRSFEINLGIKDLQRQLANVDKYDTATQEKLRDVVRSSTTNTMTGAKRRVRVVTGHTVSHINMTYDDRKNVGEVHAKSPHAHLVEFGHRGGLEKPKKKKALHGGPIAGYAAKVNIPKVAGHPFLRPAFEDEKPNLMKGVEDAIKP